MTEQYVHLAYDQSHTDFRYFKVTLIDREFTHLEDRKGNQEKMSNSDYRFFHRRNISKEEFDRGPNAK